MEGRCMCVMDSMIAWWCSVWMGREDGQEDDSYFKTKTAAKKAIMEECAAI